MIAMARRAVHAAGPRHPLICPPGQDEGRAVVDVECWSRSSPCRACHLQRATRRHRFRSRPNSGHRHAAPIPTRTLRVWEAGAQRSSRRWADLEKE